MLPWNTTKATKTVWTETVSPEAFMGYSEDGSQGF